MWQQVGPTCRCTLQSLKLHFSAPEASDEEVPFMKVARFDAPDALQLAEFRSETVCRKLLSRAPLRLDLRARGPISSGLYSQHAIYDFQLISTFWIQWRSPFLLNPSVPASRHDILT